MEKKELIMDEEHKKIKEQIDALYKEKERLQDQIKGNEGIQMSLARYRAAREEALREGKKPSVGVDKDLDNFIKELEEKAKNLKPELTIIEEQEAIDKQIQELWKKFYESEIELPPLHLKVRKIYYNEQGNIEIRHDAFGGKLWLYENSQYATPEVLIQKNDKGRPIRLIKFIRNSETHGYLMKAVQKIVIERE